MDLVRIVRSVAEAKLLMDPMRREILRLLGAKTLTGGELATILGLSPPAVTHHLQALERGKFITMIGAEAGKHGMVKKFYRANAQAFIIDKGKLPTYLRRYFIPAEIERVRGIMASLTLLKDGSFDTSAQSIERLCERYAGSILEVAQQYAERPPDDDPERLVNQLYREALRRLLESDTQISYGLSPAT